MNTRPATPTPLTAAGTTRDLVGRQQRPATITVMSDTNTTRPTRWTRLRRRLGGNTIHVGAVDADILPVPGLDSETGRQEIRRFAEQAVQRAEQTLRRAGLTRPSQH